MITVSISTAFFIYLIVPVMAILALWLVSEYAQRSKASQVESERLMTCPLCLQRYLYDRDEPVSRCPSCGTLNDVPGELVEPLAEANIPGKRPERGRKKRKRG